MGAWMMLYRVGSEQCIQPSGLYRKSFRIGLPGPLSDRPYKAYSNPRRCVHLGSCSCCEEGTVLVCLCMAKYAGFMITHLAWEARVMQRWEWAPAGLPGDHEMRLVLLRLYPGQRWLPQAQHQACAKVLQ